LRLGILLVGPPGTGKTKIVTDYTKGMFDLTNQDHIKHFN
jgi:ATP-dependent 26S proteasome regulatory subunit